METIYRNDDSHLSEGGYQVVLYRTNKVKFISKGYRDEVTNVIRSIIYATDTDAFYAFVENAVDEFEAVAIARIAAQTGFCGYNNWRYPEYLEKWYFNWDAIPNALKEELDH